MRKWFGADRCCVVFNRGRGTSSIHAADVQTTDYIVVNYSGTSFTQLAHVYDKGRLGNGELARMIIDSIYI